MPGGAALAAMTLMRYGLRFWIMRTIAHQERYKTCRTYNSIIGWYGAMVRWCESTVDPSSRHTRCVRHVMKPSRIYKGESALPP